MALQQTECKKFVLYNNDTGKFRSSKTSKRSYGKFSMANVYKYEHLARKAKNNDDVIIPITIKIDEADIFMTVLAGDKKS